MTMTLLSRRMALFVARNRSASEERSMTMTLLSRMSLFVARDRSASEGGEHDNDAAVKDVAVRNTRKMTETIRAGEDCHGGQGHCALAHGDQENPSP